MINISKNDLDPKKGIKRIGSLHGVPVFEMCTKGGLNLVALSKNGTLRVLGAGPHRVVSRTNSKKFEPELIIDELSKAEEENVEVFKHLLPYYADLVEKINLRIEQE